jgi:hypothetical protein
MDLSGWSAIATIAAVPLIVMGWFITTSKNSARTGRSSSGTTVAGDVNAQGGGLAIGPYAQVNVHTSLDSSIQPKSGPKRLPPAIADPAAAVFALEFKKSGERHGDYDPIEMKGFLRDFGFRIQEFGSGYSEEENKYRFLLSTANDGDYIFEVFAETLDC